MFSIFALRASALAIGVCLSAASVVHAQLPAPRAADHFWRKKTLIRVDLEQKQNKPLVKEQSFMGETYDAFSHRNGLIKSLVEAYERGEIAGYDPEKLNETVAFAAVADKCKDGAQTEESVIDTDAKKQDPEEIDEIDVDENEWPDEETEAVEEANNAGSGLSPKENLLLGAGKILEIVEDKIFDKNKSAYQNKPEYVRLVWVDPAGEIPEKLLVAFRYDEVAPLLAQTLSVNRQNDAASLSLRNQFELNNFDSYQVEISGTAVLTLKEAELRRQQMLEFEHNLWSF